MAATVERAGTTTTALPDGSGAVPEVQPERVESRHLERVDSPGQPSTFDSILFPMPTSPLGADEPLQPDYFADFNLDQVVSSITVGRDDYHLESYFHRGPEDLETIRYRHEVFRDLEDHAIFACISTFEESMQEIRKKTAQMGKLHERYQRERYFLDVVQSYTDAVVVLRDQLIGAHPASRGLRLFRDFVVSYSGSPAFGALIAEADQVVDALSKITYSLAIAGDRATVRRYQGEADYSAEVLQTFEKFRQGASKSYLLGFNNWLEMNPVEARVLQLVAQLFPGEFEALDSYAQRHGDYFDERIARFEREVQFYLGYVAYLAPMRSAGLSFCYPEISRQSKEVSASDTFDAGLGAKLVEKHATVVCNDFWLRGAERILVVSGPNQGGKTTFARTVGQLHHLGSLGCPVPGSSVRLYLFDQLFSHFGREEDLGNLAGKLEDDLVRVRQILLRATPDSVVILNETFSSTTLHDALFLGKKVMEKLVDLDLVCVWVTFVDELASFGPTTVSMMSTVNPDAPAERTYKVVRKPADGLAYALAIAEKYGVNYASLKGRIGR